MLVNLTPHSIFIFKRDAPDRVEEGDHLKWVAHVILKSDTITRLSEIGVSSGCYIDGIPLQYIEYGHLTYSPPKVEKTFYIVSLATALAVTDRDDFLVPYHEVRNLNGTVIGCKALAKPC